MAKRGAAKTQTAQDDSKDYDEAYYEAFDADVFKGAEGLKQFFLSQFPNAKSFIDLGCGIGRVLSVIQDERECWGADFSVGSAGEKQLLRNFIGGSDLTRPLQEQDERFKRQFDVVVSLEVWEHMRPEHEEAYLKNLVSFDPKHIVVSCAGVGQWGRHHFLCQDMETWVPKIEQLGYELDAMPCIKWGRIKSLAGYYRRNGVVFKKKA